MVFALNCLLRKPFSEPPGATFALLRIVQVLVSCQATTDVLSQQIGELQLSVLAVLSLLSISKPEP